MATEPTSRASPEGPRPYRRLQERNACDMPARLRVDRFEIKCRVVDLSVSGAGIILDAMIQLLPGSGVVLLSPDLGELSSTVRWGSHTRYGLEFSALVRQSRIVERFMLSQRH